MAQFFIAQLFARFCMKQKVKAGCVDSVERGMWIISLWKLLHVSLRKITGACPYIYEDRMK